jgi:hypothetical protein
LYSDRIQTIVRSRNHSSFDDIAETALEEESAIFSKNESYKSSNAVVHDPRFSNCNKLGHVASRHYLRNRKDTKFNQITVRNYDGEKGGGMICYNCEGKGHMARHCRKPKRHLDKPGLNKERTGGSMRSVNGLWRAAAEQRSSLPNRLHHEFLNLKVNVSKEDELLFLIDTGADVSLLKGNKLIGNTEYDPERKVRVKCVDGSPMETHGVIEATIELGNNSIIHDFQIVNKQVGITCNGSLGRDILQSARAKICYETRTVTPKRERCEMVGKAKQLETEETKRRKIGRIKLSPRTEGIVRFPVAPGSPQVAVINKRELQEGVILVASIIKVVDGYAMTKFS